MRLDEYALADATTLAALVARREVTAGELVELAIAAMDLVDPILNIVAHDLRALGRAKAADPALTGAFAGVPFLLKDLALEMAGTPYEAGCRMLRGNMSAIDSNLMTRFRQAGLVVTAKTTCAEFGAQLATETALCGVTRNPWSVEHTPGGSSGGSAAAVAAGVVPMAHANDGIGSIRIPASNCGLFGLKPNRQRLPLGPFIGDAPGSRGVEFVVCRSVRDAAGLLDAVHGSDVGAHSFAPPVPPSYRATIERPMEGLRIAVMTRSFSGAVVDTECVRAVEQTAAMCESLGCHVEWAEPVVDFAAFRRAIRAESNANSAFGLDMVAQATGRPIGTDTLEPFTLAIYRDGCSTTGLDYARALSVYGRMERDMGAFFERFDILLTPMLARPPAAIGWLGCDPSDYEGFWDRFCGDAYSPFAGVFNVTGHPAASLPLYRTANGLPIGTQMVAQFGREDVLLNLAAQLEAAKPWDRELPPIHVAALSVPRGLAC
jgi:amidase